VQFLILFYRSNYCKNFLGNKSNGLTSFKFTPDNETENSIIETCSEKARI